MGNLEKVVLRFDSAFWREGSSPRTLVYIGRDPGECPVFADFTEYAGAPTLVCMYGGQSARDALAGMTDEALAKRAVDALHALLGREIPPPRAVAVSRWRDDPYALGSYSYVPVGADADDMRLVGAPVGDRLLFAGEATVPEHYATVTAALVSGLREARRVGGASVGLPDRGVTDQR
jgi:monoamine oxidase